MGDEQKIWSRHNIVTEGTAGTFLLNMCSGSSYEITSDLASILKIGSPDDLDNETRILFMKEGIIVEDSLERTKVQALLSDQENEAGRTVSTFIIPSYQCNLKCVYCFQHNRRWPEQMDTEHLSAAINLIRSQGTDQPPITLFGGEPLLMTNMPLVSHFCEEITKAGLKFRVITNGVNLLSYLPLFKEYKDSLDYVQVTLDGPKHIHDPRRGRGSYKLIVQAVIKSQEVIPIVIRVNTDYDNINAIPSFIENAYKKLHAVDFYCAPVRNSIQFKKAKERTLEIKRNFTFTLLDLKETYDRFTLFGFRGLDVGETIVKQNELPRPRVQFCAPKRVLDPRGIIYPCPDSAGQQEFSIGDFHPQVQFVEHNWWREVNDSKCKNCNLYLLCGGGCRLEHETGYLEVCHQDIMENIALSLDYYFTRYQEKVM